MHKSTDDSLHILASHLLFGILKHLLGRAVFDQLSAVEKRCIVGQPPGLPQNVRDDNRRIVLLQFPKHSSIRRLDIGSSAESVHRPK